MAAPKNNAPNNKGTSPPAIDPNEIARKAAQEVMTAMGGAPNSPRSAAIVPERSPTEQEYQNTLRAYSPTAGPRATREALKAQRDAAEAAAKKKGLL